MPSKSRKINLRFLKLFVRKGKKKSSGGRRRLFPLKALFPVALLLFCGIVYLFQPAETRQEIRYLAGAYLENSRTVNVNEFAWDLWNLVFRKNLVPTDYKVSGECPVYGGIPREMPGTPKRYLQILQNRGYWVGYDEKLKNPAWVAYRLFALKKEVVIPERPDAFLPDTRTIAKVKSEQYTGSGFDRGHLAPNYAIARCYGAEAQQETFLMSNIVPQRHVLNTGIWKQLEHREAVNYPVRFQEIWVLTGPVFRGEIQRTMVSGIPIPDAFYKILVDESNGSLRVIAFLIQQNEDSSSGGLQKFLCSVDQIEAETGLDFFPDLSKEAQDLLEKSPAVKVW